MFDLDFRGIFILTILLIPFAIWIIGFLWLAGYIIYELIKESFLHMHLRHRKAH